MGEVGRIEIVAEVCLSMQWRVEAEIYCEGTGIELEHAGLCTAKATR
jgi:hypothetical protein